MTCVEVMKRFKVHSTFIVKGNDSFYPVGALHAVLSARHGERPAGHWVTMTTTICDVPIIAMAYAWSQKGVSYFVSTCGSSEASPVKYQSKFEDEWGNTNLREIDRPDLCHFYYEYAPLIDEHNKQRQSLLGLEKRWLTKDAWFRLITTLVGMATVDMHRMYRNYKLNIQKCPFNEIDNIGIVKFTDLICDNLRLWLYKYNRRTPQGDLQRQEQQQITRITGADGNTCRPPTAKQIAKGKSVGNPNILNCFICRRYDSKSKSFQQTTSWWCAVCHMPLCKAARNTEGSNRKFTCLEEHLYTDDAVLGCTKPHVKGAIVPEYLHIDVSNRKSKRKKS